MPKGSGKEKKVLFLMAGPLRPKPPSLELDGRLNVGTLKKGSNGPAFHPPPLLMARPKNKTKYTKNIISGQANMGVGKPP